MKVRCCNITAADGGLMNPCLTWTETFDGGWSRCPPWHQQGSSVSHGLCRKCKQVRFCSFLFLLWSVLRPVGQSQWWVCLHLVFSSSSLTRWYSRVTFQTPTEELINGFRVCLLAALQKYFEVSISNFKLAMWLVFVESLGTEASPYWDRGREGFTLNSSPVYDRADASKQTAFTPAGNLESPTRAVTFSRLVTIMSIKIVDN